MTASSQAINWPVTVLPGRSRGATTRKPVPRQLRARRVMLSLAALCATVTIVGTAQQIMVHGWKEFVFRAPGVGGTPDAEAPVSKVGVAPAPAPPALAPADTARRRRRAAPTRPTGGDVAPQLATQPARHTPTHHPQPTTDTDTTTDQPTRDQGDEPVSSPPDQADPPTWPMAGNPRPPDAQPPQDSQPPREVRPRPSGAPPPHRRAQPPRPPRR